MGTALVQFDVESVGVGELAIAVDLGDLVLFHQEVHTGHPAVGHLAAAVEGGAVVEGHLAADAEGLGFLVEDVREFGVTQQCLGRDAADVETDSAPILRLNDCGIQPQLRGADGRHVSAGSGSEDDNVIVGHGNHPNRRGPGVRWPAMRLRSADVWEAEISLTPTALNSRNAVAQYGSTPATQCRWLCSQ